MIVCILVTRLYEQIDKVETEDRGGIWDIRAKQRSGDEHRERVKGEEREIEEYRSRYGWTGGNSLVSPFSLIHSNPLSLCASSLALALSLFLSLPVAISFSALSSC